MPMWFLSLGQICRQCTMLHNFWECSVTWECSAGSRCIFLRRDKRRQLLLDCLSWNMTEILLLTQTHSFNSHHQDVWIIFNTGAAGAVCVMTHCMHTDRIMYSIRIIMPVAQCRMLLSILYLKCTELMICGILIRCWSNFRVALGLVWRIF